MTDPAPSAEFPAGAELTYLLVVADLSRAVAFYRDVVGAELVREYGGTSAVFRLAGTWLLLVTPGGPTSDKPTVVFAPPDDPDRVSAEMTFRVADCRGATPEQVRLACGLLSDLRDGGDLPAAARRTGAGPRPLMAERARDGGSWVGCPKGSALWKVGTRFVPGQARAQRAGARHHVEG